MLVNGIHGNPDADEIEIEVPHLDDDEHGCSVGIADDPDDADSNDDEDDDKDEDRRSRGGRQPG